LTVALRKRKVPAVLTAKTAVKRGGKAGCFSDGRTIDMGWLIVGIISLFVVFMFTIE